ncbi:MAG TPA: tetratricopeptide repeat protein [Candidatus Limnocylindria bacterium]|nr:tetratricopeptide repeat protein [Candidatus Limnocylindria bacterium]
MVEHLSEDLRDGLDAFARGDMTNAVTRLRAAAATTEGGTAARSEVLQRLGSALARTGQFATADETLIEAVEAARTSNDRGGELRALIERMTWRVEAGSATEEEAVELARTAIPVFEQLGDELGLAKAWHLTGDEHVVDTWAAGTAGLERALVHARRAGDQREIADILWWLAVTYHFGPTPADEAIRRCDELIGLARGDRTVEAGVLGVLAGLNAMQGRFAEARASFAQGLAILEELGLDLRMATRRTISGMIELLADDPAAAERELRWGYERLEKMGEKPEGGIARQLAEALYRQGRYDEAERYALDEVRAKLLARRGEFEGAERLAGEVIAAADRGDTVNRRGDARLGLAEVLSLAGRNDEAAAALDEARVQYEAKRNVAAVARVEKLRASLLL